MLKLFIMDHTVTENVHVHTVYMKSIRVCLNNNNNSYGKAGSEIALSWSPMRLKILHWQPEFHSWSTTFSHLATEKKMSVTSWRLPKKVNFRPWKVC